MKKILFYLILSVSLSCFAQDSSTLKNQLKGLIDSSDVYYAFDKQKANIFLQKALVQAEQNNLINLLAPIHKKIAVVYSNYGSREDIDKSFYHNTTALELYRRIGDSTGVFQVLSNSANLYNQQGDYNQAIRYNRWARDVLDVLAEYDELNLDKSASYATAAFTYHNLKLYDSAVINYKKAYDYAQRYNLDKPIEKKSNFEVYSLANMGQSYLRLGEREQAYIAFSESYSAIKKTNDSLGIAQLANFFGGLLLKEEEEQKAITYIKEALNLSKNSSAYPIHMASLIKMTQVYMKGDISDSSSFYIDKAIELGLEKSLSGKLAFAYELKAKILEKKGDSVSSLHYYRLADKLEDSLNLVKNANDALVSMANEEVKEKQKIIAENSVEREWFMFAVIVLSVITLGLVVLLGKRYYHAKQNKVAESTHTIKHRVLVTENARTAIQADTLTEINRLVDLLIKNNLSEEERSTQINKIRDLTRHQIELEDNWEQFFVHFNKVHPQYMNKLSRTYDLSTSDLKLCAFIIMNLTNKEIAQILNITPASLHVMVHRLKKKFDLPKNKNVYQFLKRLAN
ncbi:hypothetical protein GCM10009117_09030 [Gangjinia marincola]|uniref:Tetratricopeptide repeat protein n=1 Tax=Gangjinia marincola TaxID=578463 RepID=A0ABN1MF40_9FLAO